jgi:light-regulated signal transduction histidine kinase (bacteriophytochrome)
MSSVKPNGNPNESDSAAALREEHERFCAELADGLHAMAQPLTILRSAIALLAMANEAGTDGTRYVTLSARQIDRTCQLFSSVQNLLGSRTVPAKREPIEIQNVVSQLIESRSQTLDERGIQLITIATNPGCMIHGDRQRTEQALAAAIETAISVSTAGDVVKVESSTTDGFLEFAVETSRNQENDLKSFDRLNLALAKTNILSQQGRYDFTMEPFRISLALPVQLTELENSENVCCEACAQ